MYKTILVAIDGSHVAYKALQEAISLTQGLKAKLVILHVADETFFSSNMFSTATALDYIDKYQAAAREEGKIILNEAMATAQKANINAEKQLLSTNKYMERIGHKIIEYAKSSAIDLLVIGTHGRRGFRHFFLGSVAEEVIRIATIPILLVRGSENQ